MSVSDFLAGFPVFDPVLLLVDEQMLDGDRLCFRSPGAPEQHLDSRQQLLRMERLCVIPALCFRPQAKPFSL